MRSRFLQISITLAFCGLTVSACSSSDGPTASGGTGIGGFDEDIDPDALQDYMGKADGDPCANHSGGSLSGEDLLIVVNKDEERQLRASWRPLDLVPIDASDMMPGREGVVRLPALQAYKRLAAAAKSEAGLNLGIRSAFRSFETQCFTFNYKVEESGYEHAAKFSARPGRSEHQLGMAIDITSAAIGWKLTQSMGDTAEGIWLANNAYRFGFGLSYPEGYEDLSGYSYEPWHWRYIGVEAAAEMAASGLKLIEYLLACAQDDPHLDCPREVPPKLEINEGFVGGTCELPQDCSTLEGERLCLTNDYPDGYCSIPCTLYCPDRAGTNTATFCVANPEDTTVGTCHSKCNQDFFPGTGCREGYTCLQASRPNEAGTGSVCLPTP